MTRTQKRRESLRRLAACVVVPDELEVGVVVQRIMNRTGLKAKDIAALMGEPDSVNLRAILYRPSAGRTLNRGYRMLTVLAQMHEAVLEDEIAEHNRQAMDYPE